MTLDLSQTARTHDSGLALEDAYMEHGLAVFHQVQRIMRDPDDSHDLALTAWEKAHRSWKRRPLLDAEVKPWLFRIARNACLDEMRRRQIIRWERLEAQRSDGDSYGPYLTHAAQLRSDTADPEREALRAESIALVRAALRRLPPRYRECLLLRENEGLTCEDVGARLGMTSGAVRTTLCRARQRLKCEYLALSGESLAA